MHNSGVVGAASAEQRAAFAVGWGGARRNPRIATFKGAEHAKRAIALSPQVIHTRAVAGYAGSVPIAPITALPQHIALG